MMRKRMTSVVIVLMALFVAAAMVSAASQTVSGTIQHVDQAKGFVTLKAADGKTVELRAPAELLVGLQTGDAVEVKTTGKQATSIHKQTPMK